MPNSKIADPFSASNQPAPHRRHKNGSRAKLAKRFFEDLYAAWEEQGESVIARAAFHDPVAMLNVVARLMPQKIEVSTPTDGMSDERLAEMLEVAERMAAIRAGTIGQAAGVQVIDAMPQPVAALPLAHELADENAVTLDQAEEGGGGPDRAVPSRGVNTPHAFTAAAAEAPVAEHNRLDVPDSGPATAESRVAETPSLPYPVGRPFAKPNHVVERENRHGLAAAEDDIDPASLF